MFWFVVFTFAVFAQGKAEDQNLKALVSLRLHYIDIFFKYIFLAKSERFL